MAELVVLVRALMAWILNSNIPDLLGETNFWPIVYKNKKDVINMPTLKNKYLHGHLLENYNVPDILSGNNCWTKLAEALFYIFECNIFIYNDHNL